MKMKTKFLVVARYLYAFNSTTREIPICVLNTEMEAMLYAGSKDPEVIKNDNGLVETIVSYDYIEIPYCRKYEVE